MSRHATRNGQKKVKPLLFEALHMDAGQRMKRQYYQEAAVIENQCTFQPEIRTINRILGEKGESKNEMFNRLAFEKQARSFVNDENSGPSPKRPKKKKRNRTPNLYDHLY